MPNMPGCRSHAATPPGRRHGSRSSLWRPRGARVGTPEPAQSAPKRRLSSHPPGLRRSSPPPPSSPDRVDLAWAATDLRNIKVEGSLAHARFGRVHAAHRAPASAEPRAPQASRLRSATARLRRPRSPGLPRIACFARPVTMRFALDQICRALHLAKLRTARRCPKLIFLNVSPALILEGHSTRAILPRVLERYGVPAPSRSGGDLGDLGLRRGRT